MSQENPRSANDSHVHYRPKARTEDIVTTESRDEVLIYDQRLHHIHHLNSTATLVFRLADGTRDLEQIRVEIGGRSGQVVSETSTLLALTKLTEVGLLEAPLPTSLQITSSTRRQFLKRATAAGIIAPAMIASTTAPAAADSHSGESNPPRTKLPGDYCNDSSECVSDFCLYDESWGGSKCV